MQGGRSAASLRHAPADVVGVDVVCVGLLLAQIQPHARVVERQHILEAVLALVDIAC